MAVNFSTAENYFYTILNGSLSAASLETELGTQGNVDSFSTLIQNAARFKQLRYSPAGYSVLRNSKTASNNSVFQFGLFFDDGNQVAISQITRAVLWRAGISGINTLQPYPTSDLVRGYVYIKEGGHNGQLFRADMASTSSAYIVNNALTNQDDEHGWAYNQHYGVYVGGQSSGGSQVDEVDVIDFALDGAETEVVNPGQGSRKDMACGGNEEQFWIAGGDDGAPSNDIDKIDYATFTNTDTGTSLTTARERVAGKTNDSFLYVIAGDNAGALTSIEKVNYSNDAVTTASGSLTTGKDGMGASRNYDAILITGGSASASEIYTLDTTDDSVTLESETLSEAPATLGGTEGW